MRLDIWRLSDRDEWTVLHVPTCELIDSVIWVDDSTHRLAIHCGALICPLHEAQFRKIMIVRPARTVLVDPLDDVGDDGSEVVENHKERQHA